MSRYGRVGQEVAHTGLSSCTETIKNMKERLAMLEDNEEFILETLERDLFDYNTVQLALGNNRMNILRIRADIKRHKKVKK